MDIRLNNVIPVLNDLIEICLDAEEGFKVAATGLKNPGLKARCLEYSVQHSQFASELQQHVRQLGGDPASSGSVPGSLKRGWLNVKPAIASGDERAIMLECERGEDQVQSAYQKAVNTYMPADVTEVVQRQSMQVKVSRDRLSEWPQTYPGRLDPSAHAGG